MVNRDNNQVFVRLVLLDKRGQKANRNTAIEWGH